MSCATSQEFALQEPLQESTLQEPTTGNGVSELADESSSQSEEMLRRTRTISGAWRPSQQSQGKGWLLGGAPERPEEFRGQSWECLLRSSNWRRLASVLIKSKQLFGPWAKTALLQFIARLSFKFDQWSAEWTKWPRGINTWSRGFTCGLSRAEGFLEFRAPNGYTKRRPPEARVKRRVGLIEKPEYQICDHLRPLDIDFYFGSCLSRFRRYVVAERE